MAKSKKLIVDYNKIEQQIWQMAEPLAQEAGAELIDVDYLKEAGNWYLRLFIDREPPVDHDLCQAVSELVSDALDLADPIEQNYFLEVSSPGLERPLRRAGDFSRFAGHRVALKLYAPKDGIKEFQGSLIGLVDGIIQLEDQERMLCFPEAEVAKVHLIADLNE